MQRLFSMFPRGAPGVALLLLRASVTTALLADACQNRQSISAWIQALALLAALAVSAGYLTPIGALTAVAVHARLWLALGTGDMAVAAVIVFDAVALALVGPGAYSIDAYRYGRRVVVLPPD
jgi:hypothetical protein